MTRVFVVCCLVVALLVVAVEASPKLLSIEGLNKVRLLRRLWEESDSSLFYEMKCQPPPTWGQDCITPEEAVRGYVRDYAGRPIFTDISKNEVDPSEYDRFRVEKGRPNGEFARIVDNAYRQERRDEMLVFAVVALCVVYVICVV